MQGNQNNSARNIDLVSIDVWHEKLVEAQHAQVNLSLTFHQTKLGNAEGVSVDVALRGAELLFVSSDELLTIPKSKINRNLTPNEFSHEVETKHGKHKSGHGKARVNRNGVDFDASGSLSAERNQQEITKKVSREAIEFIYAFDNENKTPRWQISPVAQETLAGLNINDLKPICIKSSANDDTPIHPQLTLIIRCKRSDFHIVAGSLKNAGKPIKNNNDMAIQALQQALVENLLEAPRDAGDETAHWEIANIIVEPSE